MTDLAVSAITPTRAAYMKRVRAAAAGEPACRLRGPSSARCVLDPGHAGDLHEGNGCDAWGPMYVQWEHREKPPTWRTPRRRQEGSTP